MGAQQGVGVLSKERTAGWCEPAALTLDERGMIRDCSRSCEEMFGYGRHELVLQHVSKLLPQLSEVNLLQDGEFNPKLRLISRCGHLFQAQKQDGGTFSGELSFVNLVHAGRRVLRLIVRPSAHMEP